MNTSVRATLGVLLVAIVATAAYIAGRHGTMSANDGVQGKKPTSSAKTALYWYDPMVPQQHFDRPGLSPMGMEMVPKFADDAAPSHGVAIDASTLQNLGVRTALVTKEAMPASVDVPGNVTWDLRQAVTISARVDAIIQRLDVRAPYTPVAKGAPLVALLAPQWGSALAEAEALRHMQSPDAQGLRGASQARLRVLGLSPQDSVAATAGGAAIAMRAPIAGTVTTLDVREGQRVTAGQTLMTLNGLGSVWVEASIPQGQTSAVRAGTPVTVRTDAWPGRDFAGRVETLLPEVDAATRSQRARIVLANPDGALAPGMFARVILTPASGDPVIVVPDEAVIADGRHARVVVAEDGGRFDVAPVVPGRSSGGMTEILKGLKVGQRVVVSGQFLIDSEANLSGALDRLENRP